MSDRFDPYAVLQVSQDASHDALQTAYRMLARRLHPDLSDDPAADAQMARLNAAWEALGDPVRRAAFDRTHLAGVIHDTPGRSGTPNRSGTTSSAGRASDFQRSGRPAGPYGPTWRVGPNGEGGAGPPPGKPSGTVLDFGRHIGWSMGEIARVDPGYLEWLDKQPQGGRLRQEIDRTLRARGLRTDGPIRGPERGARRFGFSGR
ncbi:MAG: DnaJ domain-containing protein [Chloroflexota bacterium]|nr:DnaJ domain-containing protein [Chloroflexota bacterium]